MAFFFRLFGRRAAVPIIFALVLIAVMGTSRSATADTFSHATTVTAPTANGFYSSFNLATGTATDGGESTAGVVQVTGRLYRPIEGETPSGYWAGGDRWTATYSTEENQLPCTGTTSWSLQLPDLAQGSYTFRATAIDGEGHSVLSPNIVIRVDKTAPTVALAQPRADGVALKSLAAIEGTAADTGLHVSEVARVSCCLYRNAGSTLPAGYWLGGASWSEAYSAANELACNGNSNWSLTLPPLPDGAYTVHATAIDKAGNKTSTAVTRFVLDRKVPSISITEPAANNLFYSAFGMASGTATDGGEGASGVVLVTGRLYRPIEGATPSGYWAGGDRWTANYSAEENQLPCTGASSWSLQLPDLAQGSYTFRATAIDGAGNSVMSPNIVIRVDKTAPTVALAQPRADGVALKSLPALEGTTADTGLHVSEVARVTCYLYRNATSTVPAGYWLGGATWSENYSAANELVCTGTSSWVLPLPPLPLGTYACRATSTDKAGNQTSTAITSFAVAPVVTIIRPAPDNTCFSTLTTATGTASESVTAAGAPTRITGLLYRYADSGVPAGYWVEGDTWTTGASPINDILGAGTTAWSMALPVLREGKYGFRVTATDAGGMQTTTPFMHFTLDATPPVLVMTQPAADSVYKKNPSASGTVADAGTGVARVTGCLFNATAGVYWAGGATWTTDYSAVNERLGTGTANWSLALPALSDGSYTFRATATDKSGNKVEATSSFAVDKTAPILTVTQPYVEGAKYGSLDTLNGTAWDNGTTSNNTLRVTCWLYRYATGSTPAGYWAGGNNWTSAYTAANELLCAGTTDWSLALPPLAAGNYSMRATATDGIGNQASTAYLHFSLQGIRITTPRRDVLEAPSAASLKITDEGGSFFIPYIQTASTLQVAASPGNFPIVDRGIEYVLNEGQANQQLVQSYAADFTAQFENVAKGTYTLDAYLIDQNGQRVAGSLVHDRVDSIGVGDIITALGDSITAGCSGGNYGQTPFVKWVNAPPGSWSLDHRNYPQNSPTNGSYCNGFTKNLNDRLSSYFGYPVFIMNEGQSGASAGEYKALMARIAFVRRQNLLQPNKWLVQFGVNDSSEGTDPEIVRSNFQTIIDTIQSTYGAQLPNIWVSRPYAKPEPPYADGMPAVLAVIDDIVAANGLPAGPDFYSFFAPNPNPYYTDAVHPNAAGFAELSRLSFEAMTRISAPMPAPSITASRYLSGATAKLAGATVSLVFTPPLQSGAATETGHYQVTINGRQAGVVGVAYYAPVRMVTLTLEPGALRAGNAVSVVWQRLKTTSGVVFSGSTGILTAK